MNQKKPDESVEVFKGRWRARRCERRALAKIGSRISLECQRKKRERRFEAFGSNYGRLGRRISWHLQSARSSEEKIQIFHQLFCRGRCTERRGDSRRNCTLEINRICRIGAGIGFLLRRAPRIYIGCWPNSKRSSYPFPPLPHQLEWPNSCAEHLPFENGAAGFRPGSRHRKCGAWMVIAFGPGSCSARPPGRACRPVRGRSANPGWPTARAPGGEPDFRLADPWGAGRKNPLQAGLGAGAVDAGRSDPTGRGLHLCPAAWARAGHAIAGSSI
ncbi:hypothetical protein SAMN03159363_1222 [Variovorax sp. EL159]|nr:hypothetical protein SAMN03159363_1222 [Variovorax sp. EL159]